MGSGQGGSSAAPLRPRELALAGWGSRLAALVVCGLLVETLTGLWIYLLAFSVAAQIQVLLHTIAGVLILAPLVAYLVLHLRNWYRQKVSADMVLGYGLMAAVLVCSVSGVVVTWQGLFGPRLTATWDLVHLVSGLASGALLVVHLAFVFSRRRTALGRDPELARAVRGFFTRVAGMTAATGVVVLLLTVANPVEPTQFPAPENYTLPAYAQQFDEYRGSIFAPTYARTDNELFVEPAVLSGSESCGSAGCHEQILDEWEPSAHRFSAMNPPFQKVQLDFAEDRETAETRYCAGCHDPISLFAGAKDIQMMDHEAPGIQEGISCAVCHSISEVDQRGNADYVLTAPDKYLWENTTGWRKGVSDFLIRSFPRQHLADYDRNVLRTPEFCGACHKQFIPEALNRFGVSPGQNQYDEWRKSHWASDVPESDLSCRDCHMRLVYDSRDPGNGEAGDVRRSSEDGAHRHHGTIATNALMAEVLKLPHWEEQVRLTEEWIAGETVIPEIAHLWPEGPVVSLELRAPEEIAPGEELNLRVALSNRKVGHNYTTGPLDFVRAWVHLAVLDADGETLMEWGHIDPETRRIFDAPGIPHVPGNSRKDGTLVLEAQPLDEDGNPLLQHELWRKAGGEGQRVIFPRYSDQHSYSFTVPESVKGPLTVNADLNFRRYRQEFLDLVVPEMERDSGVIQPTLRQASARTSVRVAQSGAPASKQGEGASGETW